MASQLVKEPYCIKNHWCLYEQNSIVNSVGVDDWTAEWVIIASNAFKHDVTVAIQFDCNLWQFSSLHHLTDATD